MNNNSIYFNKYNKYKQKYLNLKQQLGGEVDNSFFYNVNVNHIKPEHKENLIKKFNAEQKIAEQFEKFYEFLGYFSGSFDDSSQKVSWEQILNYHQILNSQIPKNTVESFSYLELITYLENFYNGTISDSIEQFKLNIIKTKFDIGKIKKMDTFKYVVKIQKNLNMLANNNSLHAIKSDINKIIELNPLIILNKIICTYAENYNILQLTPKSSELRIPLTEPSSLSVECIFNKISGNTKDCNRKEKMFKSMGEATLKFYESSFSKPSIDSMEKYLVSYNDQIYMFVTTGNPSGNLNSTISEHIYITKTPSNYLSNLYVNKDERDVSVKLHLYALSLFRPNYIYSHPLDVMKDIFHTNFVSKGLFTQCADLEIFGFSSVALGFGIYPTVKYSVNHQVLNELLSTHGF